MEKGERNEENVEDGDWNAENRGGNVGNRGGNAENRGGNALNLDGNVGNVENDVIMQWECREQNCNRKNKIYKKVYKTLFSFFAEIGEKNEIRIVIKC